MIDAIWIDNLIKVLDYENRLCGQLFMIAENKTAMIINGETESLQAVVGKEQRLVGELNKLRDAREQIIEQIGKKTDKLAKEIVVADLINKLPENQAKRLSAERDKLKETIGRLKAKNDLNQRLIQNALEYVDFSINLLTESAPQTAQYGRKGYESERKSRALLDIKS